MPAGATRERAGDVVLDHSRSLADEENALTGAPAEHRVRTWDETGIGAAGAGAVRSLETGEIGGRAACH